MARDLKYGYLAMGHDKFPDRDEPVFVLRAQDVLARETLLHYRDMLIRFGCDRDFIASAQDAIAAFDDWHGAKKLLD